MMQSELCRAKFIVQLAYSLTLDLEKKWRSVELVSCCERDELKLVIFFSFLSHHHHQSGWKWKCIIALAKAYNAQYNSMCLIICIDAMVLYSNNGFPHRNKLQNVVCFIAIRFFFFLSHRDWVADLLGSLIIANAANLLTFHELVQLFLLCFFISTHSSSEVSRQPHLLVVC